MKAIRISYKLTCFLLGLLSYFIITFPLYIFFKISPYKALPLIHRVIQFYTRFCLFFMNIRIDIDMSKVKSALKKNYLIVSNHLSYLDIIAYCSYFPASFVTSVEIKKTPVLGQITQGAGCLFVERRNKKNLSREVLEITNALKHGFNVMIFPEATSTDGTEIKMFRRALFQAAHDSGVSILPLTINYTYLDDEPVTPKNKDYVFWYGDMDFASHLIKVFSKKEICIHVTIHDSLEVEGKEITDLANDSQRVVKDHFKLIV